MFTVLESENDKILPASREIFKFIHDDATHHLAKIPLTCSLVNKMASSFFES